MTEVVRKVMIRVMIRADNLVLNREVKQPIKKYKKIKNILYKVAGR